MTLEEERRQNNKIASHWNWLGIFLWLISVMAMIAGAHYGYAWLSWAGIAGICNAFMDTVESDASFDASILSEKDPNFYRKTISGLNKYVDRDPKKGRKKFLGIIIPAAWFDFWHRMKFCELLSIGICFALAATRGVNWFDNFYLNVLAVYCAFRTVYGTTFTLYYSWILKK